MKASINNFVSNRKKKGSLLPVACDPASVFFHKVSADEVFSCSLADLKKSINQQ